MKIVGVDQWKRKKTTKRVGHEWISAIVLYVKCCRHSGVREVGKRKKKHLYIFLNENVEPRKETEKEELYRVGVTSG